MGYPLPLISREVIDLSQYSSKLYTAKTAIFDYANEKKYTYIDLEERALRIAGFLHEIGLREGDVIAQLVTNRIELFDLFNAANKLGLKLAPINWRLTSKEVARVIYEVQPKLIVYEREYISIIQGLPPTQLKSIEKLSIDDSTKNNAYLWDDAIKSSKPKHVRSYINLNEIRMILYTGGTTGFPKPAQISAKQIIFNTISEIMTWRLNYKQKSILLLPLFHTGGWNLITIPLLAIGGTLYITRRFDPEITLEIIDSEDGHFVLFGVPTIFYMIAKNDSFKRTDFSKVEWILSGASFIDKKIMEWYWDENVKFGQGYGSTEAGPNNLTIPIHDLSVDELREKWRSVGKPFAFNNVKIVDERGGQLGPNKYGELVICGPVTFSGYLGKPEETAKILSGDCVYTGDIAYFDDDGYFYIVDRKKDVVKSGGEQIYPSEIEEAALMHPKIEDSAVIGVIDEKWGEAVKLVIKPKCGETVSKDEIIGFLERKLPRYKIPKYIAIVKEIPRNPTGKVLRRILKEKYGSAKDEYIP